MKLGVETPGKSLSNFFEEGYLVLCQCYKEGYPKLDIIM